MHDRVGLLRRPLHRAKFPLRCRDFRLRSHFARQRLLWRFVVLQVRWKALDKTNADRFVFFPTLVCGVAFLMNFIAIYYQVARAIPFLTMLAVAAICFFIILPLNLVGTILGRNLAGHSDNPTRVNAVPRPIPEKKWYMEPYVIALLGGILPFGSIFIEMYFIFTSFWAYKIYYVYGFTLLVYVILAIVTVCVTIVCAYFLLVSQQARQNPFSKWCTIPANKTGIMRHLGHFCRVCLPSFHWGCESLFGFHAFFLLQNAEDYRWQWTSFLSGASTALYVFLYSYYYFVFKTKMYGLFQTMFYFGYMGVLSVGLGIVCGTFGYIGTNAFVKKIYSTVKID